MAPHRIMFIRHAEKPAAGTGTGIDEQGRPDEESLAVRGWQRAGALARFFCPTDDDAAHTARADRLRPDIVFAPGTGPGSKSRRAMQTAMPLVALLRQSSQMDLITRHLKEDGAALMQQVLAQQGTVLISWEHKVLPSLIGHVSGAPAVPQSWPEDRFDLVWILERDGERWTFSQLAQLLLPGDSAAPIR